MLGELVEIVTRYTNRQTGDSPYMTAIKGFTVLRADYQKPPSHVIFSPALCITVQGAKWSTFGDRRLEYKAGQALVVSVEMPAFGRITEASRQKPFLGLVIELDVGVMREVMESLDTPPDTSGNATDGMFVADVDEQLTDCALRAMRLLDKPSAIPILYPTIMREVCYWLLTGPHASHIARMTLANGHAARIVKAIHVLRKRYAQPVRVEELAAVAGLSPSAFHRQFKALVSMTPLQYQKRLRLHEARRLIAANTLNVETAAFQVGYESPSQFSREYARMFGLPPRRDDMAMRSVAV